MVRCRHFTKDKAAQPLTYLEKIRPLLGGDDLEGESQVAFLEAALHVAQLDVAHSYRRAYLRLMPLIEQLPIL